MKKMKFLASFMVIISLSVWFVSSAQKPVEKNSIPKDSSASAVNVAGKQMLIFINPNGRPCQVQMAIIDQIKEKLGAIATLTYIKTTELQDREKFYQYGIRGLPTIVIADKDGKEIKRLPPGIQDEKTIMASINNR